MPQQFADKYLLATEQAAKEKPQGGLYGFEQEWNLLEGTSGAKAACSAHGSLFEADERVGFNRLSCIEAGLQPADPRTGPKDVQEIGGRFGEFEEVD